MIKTRDLRLGGGVTYMENPCESNDAHGQENCTR